MGCDIHLVCEKRRVKKGWFRYGKPKPNSSEWEKCFEPMNKELEWRSCKISSDKPWSDRHYGMFAKLADVRNYDNLEHLPIRGFPRDASFDTFYEYTLKIVPDESYNLDSDDIVSESTAKKWIEDGSSEEITLLNMPKYWRDYKYINNPDYHSPNWCSLQELEEAVKEIFYEKEIDDYVAYAGEWLALVYYMKGLEVAGYETRCVFWFDN